MRARGRLYLATIAVLAGLATHGTYAGSGDEPHYLAIAHSLAFDHDLDLSNNYGAAEPLIGGGHLEPEQHVRPGVGGILRPVHDIGMPLLFAPYVRVVRPVATAAAEQMPPFVMRRLHLNPSVLYRQFLSAAMIAIAGVLALVLFDAFLGIGISERAAFWSVLLVVLSPPLLVFSILFFTEVVSAVLCIFVFRKIAIIRDIGSVWSWIAAGAATGFLVLVHIRNFPLAMSLMGIALWELRTRASRTHLWAYAAAVGIMGLLRTWVTHHLWGTWFTTPHARVGDWNGISSVLAASLRGLAGLLVDQEYGLLIYAPVFLLAGFGAVALVHAHRRVAYYAAVVLVAYVGAVVCPLTNAHGWTGGWSPPARMLVPIVPLLAIAVAIGMQRAPLVLVVPLVTIQIGIDAYAWQHPKILWNDGDGRAAVCSDIGNRTCAYAPSLVDRR